jgi:hypothetical protein
LEEVRSENLLNGSYRIVLKYRRENIDVLVMDDLLEN